MHLRTWNYVFLHKHLIEIYTLSPSLIRVCTCCIAVLLVDLELFIVVAVVSIGGVAAVVAIAQVAESHDR